MPEVPASSCTRVPVPVLAPHLMESDDRLGMDADNVQTPTIALKQLCEQAEEDSTDLLILQRGKDSVVTACLVKQRVQTSQFTGAGVYTQHRGGGIKPCVRVSIC